MKRIVTLIVAAFAGFIMASCMEKAVAVDQLPAPAREFINTYFPGDKIVIASKDDDIVRPDYEVILESGTELQFSSSGALEKVSCSKGIPAEVVPQSIRDYVSAHYPSAGFREYEVERRTYEVTLTNGLELKFNSVFIIMEVDD